MKERKHSFNIVDAAVILIIAAAAVIIGVRYSNRETAAGAMKVKLSYVMRADMVSDSFAEDVVIGDAVYDKDTRKLLGRVTDVGRENSEVPGYKTLYITAEADDAESGDSYKVKGIAVRAGERYSLSFCGEENRSLYCRAECISVDAAAGDN